MLGAQALKGYVFVSSGACRLAMPKDDRATLGLVQPLLLLQLEVGVVSSGEDVNELAHQRTMGSLEGEVWRPCPYALTC